MRVLRRAALAVAACAAMACGAEVASTSPSVATPSPTDNSITAATAPRMAAPGDCQPFAGDPIEATMSASVEVISNGDNDTPMIEAAIYPRPDYPGKPWTAWGQGAVAPDGRLFSTIGDHLGEEGNSFLYAFDPSTGLLSQVADLQAVVGETSWGFGKVHGQMVAGPCGELYFSTYWGDKPPADALAEYEGDVLLRLDPSQDLIEALGSPVLGHGVPSLSGSAAQGLVFGEGVDPAFEPKDGPFFAYDVRSQKVVFESEVADDHQGFRNIAVDAEGKAYFSGADYQLLVYDPATGVVDEFPAELPGKWLRASTAPGPDGTIYAATREPDMLFSFTPDGSLTTFGPAPDYVASLALHPDGTRFYFVPSAHGLSWQLGTPLIEMDVATGESRVVTELNPLGEAGLGLSLGGTYGLVVDPSGERLYIVMNSGVPENVRDAAFGEVVLVIVHLT